MKRPVLIITGLVYLMTSLPYAVGYLSQTSSRRFTGIVFDFDDTAQYFAWMRAFSHSPLIANPLTPDEGSERFFNLQWWLLGVVAHETPLGTSLTYQLLRVLALAGFALAIASLCKLVIPRQATLAFAIIMLASGFGWVLVCLEKGFGMTYDPLNVQIAEANTWLSAMAFPHLLVAGGAMIAIYVLFIQATGPKRWSYSALIWVLTMALGFSHGYDLIPTMAIPLATTFVLSVRDRGISEFAWPAAAIVAGAGPPALYALALTTLDNTWSGVLSQYGNADVYSPLPPDLLIVMGLPFVLALWQVRPAAWHALDTPNLMVRIWLVLGFALLYIPTDYQIKMLTAWQVPVGILAAQTIQTLMPRMAGRLRAERQLRVAVPAMLAAFVLLTNVYLTLWRVDELRGAGYPYHISDDDLRALETLDQLTQKDDIVLSSFALGLLVPVYTDSRPYVAHWAQTLEFLDRRAQSKWFFTDASDSERDAFLREHGIDFVIVGPAEAAEASRTENIRLVLPIVSEDETSVYRVSRSDGTGT